MKSKWLVLLVALAGSLSLTAAELERYVAVDNVCAWPNLTLLKDGTIVAAIFNHPSHGLAEGDVECWASTDGGKIWKLRGVPAPHEPRTNRMNVAAGTANDGSLIVLASGWGGAEFSRKDSQAVGKSLYRRRENVEAF